MITILDIYVTLRWLLNIYATLLVKSILCFLYYCNGLDIILEFWNANKQVVYFVIKKCQTFADNQGFFYFYYHNLQPCIIGSLCYIVGIW